MKLRTAAALASIAFAVACSSSDRPAASNSGSARGPGEPRPAAIEEPDASSLYNPALCEGLALGGEPVTEIEHVAEAPEPVGGELLEGTYDLVESTVFITSNPDCVDAGPTEPPENGEPDDECPRRRRTDRVRQATLVVTQYALQRVEASGVGSPGAPSAAAMVYEIDGTSLATTSLCPVGDAKEQVPYTASGAALSLLIDGREELFVRRP